MGQPESIRASVLRALEGTGDLPALAATVTRVNAIAQAESGSAKDLARIILDDYTLTARVLRVVNSPLYPRAGEVTTVSRAIVVMGWNEIHRLTLAMNVLDVFAAHAQVDRVREAIEVAYFGALLSERLAESVAPGSSEPAFIAGLFHAFGDLLVATFLGDKVAEAKALAEQQGVSETAALPTVLGMSPLELGRAVAVDLSLPPAVIETMHKPNGLVPRPKHAELLTALAHAGHALAGLLLSRRPSGEVRREAVRLLAPFAKKEQEISLEKLVLTALDDLALHAASLGLAVKCEQVTDRAASHLGMEVTIDLRAFDYAGSRAPNRGTQPAR